MMRVGQVWEEVSSEAVVLILKSIPGLGGAVQHHLLYLIHEKKGDSADEWTEFREGPWEDDDSMRRIA